MGRQLAGTTEHRLEALERTVDMLRGAIQTLLDRPRVQRPRNVRYARTVDVDGYPAIQVHPNTYPIIFIDAEYPETIGHQARTDDFRSVQPHVVVHSLFEEWIPPNTFVQCWWENERWWTDWSPDRQDIIHVTDDMPDSMGYYPAIIQRFDVITESWVTIGNCRVMDLNG